MQRRPDGSSHLLLSLDYGAEMLGEVSKLLEAALYNDDNLN